MPLGLLALGSWLEGRHVVIVDGRFELAPEARVVELARSALLLGVSVRTGEPLREALRVSRAARAASPRLSVVWGGPHVLLDPESCFESGVVDGCVPGAGEEALQSAVSALRSGRPLASAPGLQGGGRPRAHSTRVAADAAVAARRLLAARRGALLRGARREAPRLLLEPRQARRPRLAGVAPRARGGRGGRARGALPGGRALLPGRGLLRRRGARRGDRGRARRRRRAARLARRGAARGRARGGARRAAAARRERLPRAAAPRRGRRARAAARDGRAHAGRRARRALRVRGGRGGRSRRAGGGGVGRARPVR